MVDIQTPSSPVAKRRRGRICAEAASTLPRAERLVSVTDLVGVGDDTMSRARRLLDLLGDPGRRTVFEMIARSPQRVTPGLIAATALSSPDVLHRLRSLVRVGAAHRHAAHDYRLEPAAAKSLATYFDVLATAYADTAEGAGRGH